MMLPFKWEGGGEDSEHKEAWVFTLFVTLLLPQESQ